MRPGEIEIGKTYANIGRGTTIRKVIAIGPEYAPEVYYSEKPPPKNAGPGVLFTNGDGTQGRLFLKSFAAWAGKEVNGLIITETDKYTWR